MIRRPVWRVVPCALTDKSVSGGESPLPRATLPQATAWQSSVLALWEKAHTSGKLGKKSGAHYYLSKTC